MDKINAAELVAKGEVYRRQIAPDQLIGSPKNPKTDQIIEAKFVRLVSRILGADQTYELLKAFNELEYVDNINDLTRLYSQLQQ